VLHIKKKKERCVEKKKIHTKKKKRERESIYVLIKKSKKDKFKKMCFKIFFSYKKKYSSYLFK